MAAVDDVTDAVATTRAFLTPFDVRQWLKLALLAFFISGGMSLPTAGFDGSGATSDVPADQVDLSELLTDEIVVLLVALGAAAVIVAILFAVIGAIMEFVFIESLRNGEVRIRRYWSRRWGQGLRLFVFRVVIGLPVLAVVLGWLVLVFGPLFFETGAGFSVGLFLLGLPLLFVLFVLYGVVASFTTVFVVPIMVLADCGVLAGWRRLWTSIRRNWKEYLVYAILAFVLTIALGMIASIVIGLAGLFLLIPLGGLALVTHLTISVTSTAGLAIIAVLALLFVLALMTAWAIVQVPIVVYLRYYALLVLGDVAEGLDLIPDQRAAVRD